MMKLAHLPARGVISVGGEDRVGFLQGLVSNDVALAAPGRGVWAALLTPQGKWLADFFIAADGERLLLDCERAQAADLVRRFSRFRLRSKVEISDVSDALRVFALWEGGDEKFGPDAIAYPDPRLPDAGMRIIAAKALATNASADAYDSHRLALGLPDGSRDMEPEKSVLLEAGFDRLNGVSFTKGCYMGQELTARTHYRGLVKRRLVPVDIEGAAPEPGAPVMHDGHEVGTMRSSRAARGLALLRIDAPDGPLACGGARLMPRPPSWLAVAETQAVT
jgi:folate-binding protein YgfZ